MISVTHRFVPLTTAFQPVIGNTISAADVGTDVGTGVEVVCSSVDGTGWSSATTSVAAGLGAASSPPSLPLPQADATMSAAIINHHRSDIDSSFQLGSNLIVRPLLRSRTEHYVIGPLIREVRRM